MGPRRVAGSSPAMAARTWVVRAAAMGDGPGRAVAVLADEERAVVRDRDPDGTRPDGVVVHDKAGHEILVLAARNAIFKAHTDHLVAGALRAVPRAVLGRKRIATVFRGELVAIVKDHSHRC